MPIENKRSCRERPILSLLVPELPKGEWTVIASTMNQRVSGVCSDLNQYKFEFPVPNATAYREELL